MTKALITDLDLIEVAPKGSLIGFANFVVERAFSVNGVAIHRRLNGNGIRLVYPSKKLNSGREISLIYPTNSEIYQMLESVIFEKYQQMNIGGKNCEKSRNEQPPS